jgi:hypothetical protein
MSANETASVRINKKAARLLQEIAEANGCSMREYLEALLHYAGSIHNRPGSWEANTPFALRNYVQQPDDDMSGFADRWF